jgi:hypothetical protein
MRNKPTSSPTSTSVLEKGYQPKLASDDNLVTAALPDAKATLLGLVATQVRTKRAAAQFKSPLPAGSLSGISSVRLTPTIQALEQKVQLLKRAVRVKKEGKGETLEKLVKKWTEAGREVAYELWGLVKDMGDGERKDGWKGNDKGFERSWGWQGEQGKSDRSWGWENKEGEREGGDVHEKRREEDCCDEEEERREDTLGTMLKQLGIAAETLGWNEEEGEFVGE